MSQYRFVGCAPAQIMDTPYSFNRYGQLVEIPDELAAMAIANRVHLLPAADFDALGHTPEHLKQFNNPAMHASAPEEFIRARNAAWLKVAENRERAAKPAEPEPPGVVFVSAPIEAVEEKPNV